MWRSLFQDMYTSLSDNCNDVQESVVLGVHLFNVSKGLQCTGLQEEDLESQEILPENWKSNPSIYSFRYRSKSVTIHQRFLRLTENKINIHALRTDQLDKIIHFTINLNQIPTQVKTQEFYNKLIEDILIPYEKEVLSLLIPGDTTKKEDKKVDNKKKSILEDDGPSFNPYPRNPLVSSNPYGFPFGGAPGNLVGPNHPVFSNPQPYGARWEPPAPFFMPPSPDNFNPPGLPGFRGFDPRFF